MNGRTQLVELVPLGRRAYVGIALAGAAIIALLESLHAAMSALASKTTDGRVAALDLDGEGSLAVWFSSFTLVAAAAACALVAALRCGHAQGRRLWLWAAACWTVMSIDECASLHEAFKQMMTHATGVSFGREGILWWAAAYFGILSCTGLALLRAMRGCRAAQALLVGTAGLYAVAVLCELGWLTAKDVRGVMLEEGCEMAGNLCVLLSAALFARHTAREILAAERDTFRVSSRRAA